VRNRFFGVREAGLPIRRLRNAGNGEYCMKGDGKGPSASVMNWSTAASTVRSADTSPLKANFTLPNAAGMPQSGLSTKEGSTPAADMCARSAASRCSGMAGAPRIARSILRKPTKELSADKRRPSYAQ
jgi:hypothetical protein